MDNSVLKNAQKEIEDIYKKYDLAGVSHLIYRNKSSTRAIINPTYSIVSMNENESITFDPDKAVDQNDIYDSVFIIFSIKEIAKKLFIKMTEVYNIVSREYKIECFNKEEKND